MTASDDTQTATDHAELVADARVARAEGTAKARHAADPRLILAIDAEIARANAAGERWSVNDIRDEFPVVSSGLVGDRVRAAMMRRPVEMVKVDETPSTLGNTHAKPVAVWLGAEHVADPGIDFSGVMDLADAITAAAGGAEAAREQAQAGLPPLDAATARHLVGLCRRTRFWLGSVEDLLQPLTTEKNGSRA